MKKTPVGPALPSGRLRELYSVRNALSKCSGVDK